MKSRWSVLLALAFLPLLLSAQDEASRYMRQAGEAALLYRGHKAFVYPMAFNGTYFWEGPAFQSGDVVYNGKHYAGLSLNVDASRQDLLVKTPSGNADKVLSRDLVEQFTMGGHRFLNMQRIYGADAPSGYWEVLYDGQAKVVRQVRRSLRQDLDGSLSTQMGYDIASYRPNVHQTFLYEEALCYVTKDGQVVPLRRRSQLMKFYKEHKREISRYISRSETSGRLDFATYCTKAVRFAETLSK